MVSQGLSIFLDTSVMLSGLIDFGESSRHSQKIFDAIAEKKIRRLHTAWHCCLEILSVATRLPGGFRLSMEDTLRLLREEILPEFKIHQLPPRSYQDFLLALERENIGGGRVHDAHIAEIARRAGVKIVITNNPRHFKSLLGHGVQVLSDVEFARLLT